MAQDKDFKRLVRTRMSETGERYTVARAALRGSSDPHAPGEIDRWIEQLGLPGTPGKQNEGYERLEALPEPVLRRVAIRGLSHSNWRVRRRCAQLLDDIVLTGESIAALTAALKDGEPGVRQAALHSLCCVGCKPDSCAVDVRSVATPLLNDPSADVRSTAVGAFHHYGDARFSFDDDETIELLERVRANDVSARVRGWAAEFIRDKQRRRAGEAARQELPEELRRKTERHPGKYVAIADGLIVSAHVSTGKIRRDLKGTGRTDALVVFVDPRAVSAV